MKRELAAPIQIHTPCPKRWQELVGDERKRFCSECSLHVVNAAALTRREAQRLVSDSSERVCMRIEYDAQGAPVHLQSRLARWVLGAGAALLAACQGGSAVPAPAPAPAEPPSTMGRVAARQELGDVAVPPPAARPTELLGGVTPDSK